MQPSKKQIAKLNDVGYETIKGGQPGNKPRSTSPRCTQTSPPNILQPAHPSAQSRKIQTVT